MQSPATEERVVAVAELGAELAALRLCDAAAIEAMRRSMARHGQLNPVAVFASGTGLEIVDGFKRVQAAQALGWSTLRAHLTGAADALEAKVMLLALHERRGLTELEEGWLIRSLYRDHGMTQPAIARRLGRHKSWVFRRLMLVEALDPVVQADVRLGLLAARAAVTVGQLPRGNQPAAAELVVRRGLTVRQAELLVAELLDLADDGVRAQHIARRMEGPRPSSRTPTRAARNEADWIAADLCTLRRVAVRLEARLRSTALATLGPEAAALVVESLSALAPVLGALQRTMADPGRKDAA